MKKLREDINRYRWFILGVCAISLVLRWWGMRGQPQRLMEISDRGSYAIHNGELYRLVREGPADVVLLSMPVEGGKAREIFRERLPGATVGYLDVTDAGITYRVTRELTPPAWLVEQAKKYRPPAPRKLPPPRLGIAMGTAMQPGGPGWQPTEFSEVHIVPLQGGKTRVIPEQDATRKGLPPSVESVMPVGRTLYWIEKRVTGGRMVGPVPAERHLQLDWQWAIRGAPAKGGETHTAVPEIPVGTTTLRPGETGLFWTAPIPKRGTDYGIFYLPEGGSTPRLVRSYHNESMDEEGRASMWSVSDLVEYDGRIVYSESVMESGVGGRGIMTRHALATCRLDGTDYRQLRPPRGETHYPYALQVHRGKILGVMPKLQPGKAAAFGVAALNISNTLSTTTAATSQLAGNLVTYDGPYAYISVLEEHDKGWFDWSQSGLAVRVTQTLYRTPLKL
jgi:hypothetical protein